MGTATGFVPDRLEKTVRLLALADEIAAHPYLGGRLALTGGTALNMFVLPAPRLSFDLDFNYVGAVDRATMLAERPDVEDALAGLFPNHGLREDKTPKLKKGHAGGKWKLRYRNAWGRSESISVDVAYVRRVPLWPTTRRDSHRIGRWQATGVPVFDVHEIAAGKLSAFYDRGYPRDLFDAGLIPDIPGLDPVKLRTAFVVYGGGARADWRAVCRESPTIQSAALARQLRSALTTTDAQRTRPLGADAFLAELTAKAAPAQRMVVPLNPTEVEFLDRLLDHGDIAPELLTADPALQQSIASELWLTWKAINVRDHNARLAHQRGVPEQPTTAPAYPSLTVQPDNATEWGWTLMVRQPDGEPVATSGRYPSESDAAAACDFAAGLASGRFPLRFAEWEPGSEYRPRRVGGDAITVRPVPVPGGWKLVAYRPDGDLEAESHLYPTYRAADMAQGFLRSVDQVQPRQVRIGRECDCPQLGRRCHHFDGLAAPMANPVSVSVRPNPRSTQGWELVTRDEDGAPLGHSAPYPTEKAALDASTFALRVVNGPHPILFDGWQPWRGAQGVGHIPPTDDEAAATVRILPPTPPDTWRLEARRRSGTVIRTSLLYPSYEAAHAAVDYLATLAAMTGDPQRAGRVTDTTLAGDRECACQTLGAHCLHYETDDHDDRGPDRGLSLGF